MERTSVVGPGGSHIRERTRVCKEDELDLPQMVLTIEDSII